MIPNKVHRIQLLSVEVVFSLSCAISSTKTLHYHIDIVKAGVDSFYELGQTTA